MPLEGQATEALGLYAFQQRLSKYERELQRATLRQVYVLSSFRLGAGLGVPFTSRSRISENPRGHTILTTSSQGSAQIFVYHVFNESNGVIRG